MEDLEERALTADLLLSTVAGLNAVDKSMIDGSSKRALQIDAEAALRNLRRGGRPPAPPMNFIPPPNFQEPPINAPVPPHIMQHPQQPIQHFQQPPQAAMIQGFILPEAMAKKLDAIDEKLDRYIKIVENIEKCLGKILLSNAGSVKITLSKSNNENSNTRQRKVSDELSDTTEQD